jgi:hypothetical protein
VSRRGQTARTAPYSTVLGLRSLLPQESSEMPRYGRIGGVRQPDFG